MFYEKLNAKHWQEEAAMHSEWAIDYLLNGELEKAAVHQRISSDYAEYARNEMDVTA